MATHRRVSRERTVDGGDAHSTNGGTGIAYRLVRDADTSDAKPMSVYGRGRAAVGRTVERGGAFAPVRTCTPSRMAPHPSNLREAKAQGRITRGGKDERRGAWIADGSERPRSRTETSSIDRPIGRRSCASPLHLAVSLARRVDRRERQSAPNSTGPADRAAKPLRRMHQQTARGSEQAETRVRPEAGSNLRRESETQECRRVKGVESDTVTRVTHGPPCCGPRSRDGTPISFEAEKGPDQVTEAVSRVAERRAQKVAGA